MPSFLALLCTAGLVLYLFRYERRWNVGFSIELWVPLAWFFLTGTRFTSQWIQVLFGIGPGDAAATDGSPLDAGVFVLLILSGVLILAGRPNSLSLAVHAGFWVTAFLLYGLVSILWSDFPFVALKRWIKVTGHPIMALIVLTSPDASAAFRGLVKRFAYLVAPLSILLIKYYPHIGRGFDPWEGAATNNGACISKNELGALSAVFAVFFVWNLLQARQIVHRRHRRYELLVSGLFLLFLFWTLLNVHSATAVVCTIVGVGVVIASGLPWINSSRIGTYLITGAAAYFILNSVFGIYAAVIEMLGRDPNLTDRTEVWADALALVGNPLLGAGFESFWLGSRLDALWQKWWWKPNQAHNGYIETYLNLGLIGTALLAGMILSAFRRAQSALCSGNSTGRLHLALLAVILLTNFTEATFKAVSPMWTFFCIISIAPLKNPAWPALRRTRSEGRGALPIPGISES